MLSGQVVCCYFWQEYIWSQETHAVMKSSVACYSATLIITGLLMELGRGANAEGVLVDRVTFDGDMDSEFGEVDVTSNGGAYFLGTRYSVMGECASLLPSIDERYLSIYGFEDVLQEGTITFWAQAHGRGSVGGLRVFEMSSQGTKAAAAHTFSLHTDSTVEATLLDYTFHNQSFHSRIEQHDPYQWNLYSYSYSMLTGEVRSVLIPVG